MASYSELANFVKDTASPSTAALLSRLKIAIVIRARVMAQDADADGKPTLRRLWGINAISQVDDLAEKILWLVAAQHQSNSANSLASLTDAEIQSSVDAAIDLLTL